MLGERGRGYAQFLATLDDGRVAIAALAVGCIQACLDMSVTYAGERTTMGGPIGRKQGVAFQIADMEVMLQASRLLTYKAAALKDAGAPHQEIKRAASVAKLYSTESAVSATRIATCCGPGIISPRFLRTASSSRTTAGSPATNAHR